jgi:hypothetical protein
MIIKEVNIYIYIINERDCVGKRVRVINKGNLNIIKIKLF